MCHFRETLSETHSASWTLIPHEFDSSSKCRARFHQTCGPPRRLQLAPRSRVTASPCEVGSSTNSRSPHGTSQSSHTTWPRLSLAWQLRCRTKCGVGIYLEGNSPATVSHMKGSHDRSPSPPLRGSSANSLPVWMMQPSQPPFICSFCSKFFSRQYHLRRHVSAARERSYRSNRRCTDQIPQIRGWASCIANTA